ncbi:MAG TPA: hypothetical protein PKG54_17225 [Phycisphaerae bacterium]|nr:hypothetical protein [Phycisphaerae bacterium]HOB76255.1 hypothetical protein [Phycisphaerae bacterium]HOJ56253.1 hypothetical protein [Phycisphaerae bacterium]HOL27855.1 hypothetical protein [Phycisphaerae bacterium]HPP19663.1 hypothetical protein [Phycisphaerae bacterium]
MRPKKPKASAKPYWEMNTEELARATAEFDQEFIVDTFKPLTPEQQREWRRIKRKLGRPRKGKGAKVISVSVERGLLARSDRLAKKLGITRAALIAQGLEHMLEKKTPARRRTGT